MRTVEESLLAPILVRSGALLQIRGAVPLRGLLQFDPASTRQIAWRASLSADDVFWRSDSIGVLDGSVRLFANGEVAADDEINVFENRFLCFE